jgi:hypothetical protein
MDMIFDEDAKNIFFAYNGEEYHMYRDAMLSKYKSFNIPEYIELRWRHELIDGIFLSLSKNECDMSDVAKFGGIVQLLGRVKERSLIEKAMRYLEENFDKYDSFSSVIMLENSLQILDYLDAREKCVLCQRLIDLSAFLKKKHYFVKEVPKFLSADDVSLNSINKRIDEVDSKLKEILEN